MTNDKPSPRELFVNFQQALDKRFEYERTALVANKNIWTPGIAERFVSYDDYLALECEKNKNAALIFELGAAYDQLKAQTEKLAAALEKLESYWFDHGCINRICEICKIRDEIVKSESALAAYREGTK